MKAIVKSLSLLSVMMFFCLTLVGQKNLIVKDIQPLLTFTSDIKYDVELSAERNFNGFQFYIEDKVELQNWMINRSVWNSSGSSSSLAGTVLEDREAELVMEEWMVQPFSITKDKLRLILTEEKEAPLKLYEWMICCTDWNMRHR